MKKSNSKLLGAAVTGLIGAAFALSTVSFAESKGSPAPEPAAGKFKCEGGNGCKGQSACETKGKHGCHGQNTCKGQGWVWAKDKADCDKMKAALKKS